MSTSESNDTTEEYDSDDEQRSDDVKNTLYGKQAGICNGCRNHYRIKDLEVDHVKPKSRGGRDVDDNLQLLCGSCNRIKGGRDMKYLRDNLRKD
ncbi:MAG: HNH endonuclease signature motif containing protein [Candidatus Nitrosoabyssus spongiisocia]|nr:MAG: HNH endonuclease signature motif containing protein [Nitrosopumilaceae archaeon AB1(1)]